jgi:hypothetical protein
VARPPGEVAKLDKATAVEWAFLKSVREAAAAAAGSCKKQVGGLSSIAVGSALEHSAAAADHLLMYVWLVLRRRRPQCIGGCHKLAEHLKRAGQITGCPP